MPANGSYSSSPGTSVNGYVSSTNPEPPTSPGLPRMITRSLLTRAMANSDTDLSREELLDVREGQGEGDRFRPAEGLMQGAGPADTPVAEEVLVGMGPRGSDRLSPRRTNRQSKKMTREIKKLDLKRKVLRRRRRQERRQRRRTTAAEPSNASPQTVQQTTEMDETVETTEPAGQAVASTSSASQPQRDQTPVERNQDSSLRDTSRRKPSSRRGGR